MTILTRPYILSSHWYKRNGEPFHIIQLENGETRPTTLADARKLGLIPSVTSILSILAKPALDTWKQQQAALAAVQIPIEENEDEKSWLKRVLSLANEQTVEAADLGNKIHQAIENHLKGETFSKDLNKYLTPFLEWMGEIQIKPVAIEQIVVNMREGFAGKADLFFKYGKKGKGVLDYKTRKTKPGEKVQSYEGQAMQLAAYAATYWGEKSLDYILAANVYISTTEPGRFEVIKYDNLRKHYEVFKCLCEVWRYLKDYDPRDFYRNEV